MGPKRVLQQEEAHLNFASWQQSSSSLRALREYSCPEEGRMPRQLLTSVPKPSPGADGTGAWRVRDCSDPRTGTRAGLQPLMDQGSDPPSSRCRIALAAVSLPSPTPAGLFLAAVGRVVPHGRKGCLTGVNGDGNPGGVPRFPSSPGARG